MSAAPPAGDFGILFVCTANICRSPFAEGLMRARLAAGHQAEGPWRITSAGVRGRVGFAMDERAASHLVRLGGDPDGFLSRSLTAPMVADADLVLAMTLEQRGSVLMTEPRALRKTFTLLEFAWLCGHAEPIRRVRGDSPKLVAAASRARGSARPERYDVADVFGASDAAYAEMVATVSAAVDTISRALDPTDWAAGG